MLVNITLGYLAIGALHWALVDGGRSARDHLLARLAVTGLRPRWHEVVLLNAREIITWPRYPLAFVRHTRTAGSKRYLLRCFLWHAPYNSAWIWFDPANLRRCSAGWKRPELWWAVFGFCGSITLQTYPWVRR